MEQFDRVERYLNKIRNVYSGENQIFWKDRKMVEDDILSFFIHCHHLQDWILTLNRVGVSQTELKGFIEKHDSLKLCADIANRSKHCRLTKKQWSNAKPHLAGRQYTSNGDADSPGIKGKFTIITRNKIVDVLELAETCWKLWLEFSAELETKFICDNQKQA